MTPPTAVEADAHRDAVAVWPSIAAWGGGLILVALGAGALTAADGGPALATTAILLLVAGAAVIAWGTVTLIRARVVVPKAGIAGAMASAALAIAAFAQDPVRMGILAVAPAVALLVVTAVACALRLRGPAGGGPYAGSGGPRRLRVAEIIVGAILASALVTPALASVEAGHLAPPGENVVTPDIGHQH
ncbi:hypothetical protein OED01_02325 [Microbacterium sp. M28]|uniref:hypothetical protein n=1 Tax=Microbacterium sp. M28 TaxID=2962064 RepID=UPI0021F4DF95|nr:hypothetical protein [Microbacterium sp. M28]UYO97589.1 hypothetical protein OED01_02325 [Microbacterium sp. M28]